MGSTIEYTPVSVMLIGDGSCVSVTVARSTEQMSRTRVAPTRRRHQGSGVARRRQDRAWRTSWWSTAQQIVEARTDGVGESRGCAAREAAGGGADASRRRRGPRPPEGAKGKGGLRWNCGLGYRQSSPNGCLGQLFNMGHKNSLGPHLHPVFCFLEIDKNNIVSRIQFSVTSSAPTENPFHKAERSPMEFLCLKI